MSLLISYPFLNNKYSKVFILINMIIIILFQVKFLKTQYSHFSNNNELQENIIYSFNEYAKNITSITELYFKFSIVNTYISFKFNLFQVEYNIFIFDKNKNIINPIQLALLSDLHIICHMNEIDLNIYIDSLAYIKGNNYFKCIEYFKSKENVKLGIKLYKNDDIPQISTLYFISNEHFFINKYHHKLRNDLFNLLFINDKFRKKKKKIENKKNKSFLLELSYIEWPICLLKREIAILDNKWYYRNVYNKYFCFCKGPLCIESKINQKCKYRFYLVLIDNNKILYPKTHYLLADHLKSKISEDYSYSIFIEMIKEKLNAHYMTQNEKIYNNYCFNNSKCLNSFDIIKGEKINGDFLEKYFELVLKLKAVISSFDYYSFDNIFYNIDYITYIFLGHGVPYFKEFLFNDYQSCQKYNKMLIHIVINLFQ